MDFSMIHHGLASFAGVERRMQTRGAVDGVTIVDDYGHHPTEIQETLGAMRQVWNRERVIVVFQPHATPARRRSWMNLRVHSAMPIMSF